MEVILAGRAGGKTTRMLDWMAEQPPTEERVVVTITHYEAIRLRRLAKERGLDPEDWRFISVGEVARGSLRGRTLLPTVLGVDNAEMVLSAMLGYRVGALSVTPE